MYRFNYAFAVIALSFILLIPSQYATAATVVRVGSFENYPIVFKDDLNVVSGFSIDLLKAIAEKEQWQLEFVHDSFKDNYRKTLDGQLDIIVGLAFTEERNKLFRYTEETALNNWGVVYQSKNAHITSLLDLQNKKVVLVEKNIHSKVFQKMMDKFGFTYTPVFVQSPQELIKLLESNQVSAGVINRLSSLKYAGHAKIKPTSIIFNPVEVRYATFINNPKKQIETVSRYLKRWKDDPNSVYYQKIDYWLHAKNTQDQFWIWIAIASLLLLSTSFYLFLSYSKKIQRKHRKDINSKSNDQQQILENLIEGVVIIDQHGTILRVNKSISEIFGYNKLELLGNNVRMLMPEDIASQHDAYLESYMSNKETKAIGNSRDVLALRKDGQKFQMRLTVTELSNDGDNIRFVGTCVDITNEKKQESYIQRSQKMEAIGQLTSGIAHDYNNMLGVVKGFSQLLKEKVENDEKIVSYVGQIDKAADRGVRLTQKLLAFSRSSKSNKSIVNINKVLTDEVEMLQKTITPRIKLHLDLAKTLKTVYLDKHELIESIVNMSINSMHAMPDGGTLSIKTECVNFDEKIFSYNKNENGNHIRIEICDTGIGMSAQQLNRIFEPFYSTKGVKGTGLGLSQVYGFISENGGAIDAHSEIGKGTCFDIILPVFDGIEEESSNTQIDNYESLHKKSILIVDDETSILSLVSEILESHNMKVFTTDNAEQALEIISKKSIDVLLTDIIMPDIDGYSLVQDVIKKYPEIKIQLMSGYSNIQGKDEIPETLLLNLLEKPFSADALLSRLLVLMQEK